MEEQTLIFEKEDIEKIDYKKCGKCGYEWKLRRKGLPKMCPRCKSYYWNEKKEFKQYKQNHRKLINPRKKQKVFERDNFTCIECDAKGDFNCLEVDHIIPVSKGGTNDYDNLQTLCYNCNMRKRDREQEIKKDSLEILEEVKNKIKEHKELSWAEFKVVFKNEQLYRNSRLSLLDIEDLFCEIKGINIAVNNKITNNYRINTDNRYKEQRDFLIKYLNKEYNIGCRKLERIFRDCKFPLGKTQISDATHIK